MSTEPIPLSEFTERLRRKAVQAKAAISADPALPALIEKRIAEHEAMRAADHARWRESVLEQTGIPRRLWGDLDTLRDTEAVRATREWQKRGKTFLVLEGDVGVGKTYAAASFVARPGCLFRKARDVAALSSFDTEAWNRLYRVPALALDDLGTEPLDDKGWALSGLLGLIDRRYDDAARTVITTNLGPNAIRERYGRDGGRLFDRLREAADWVQLGGASLRKAGEPWT